MGGSAVAEELGRGPLSGLLPSTSSQRSSKDSPTVFPLNTGWSVAKDPGNIGKAQGWAKAIQISAASIRVPSILQEVYPAYHGVAWYWLQFASEPNPFAGGSALIRFQAVDYLAEVWLNGTHLGMHEGGETPFVCDATAVLRNGSETNLLAVRVLNPVDQSIDGIVLAETPHRNKFVKIANGALPDFGGIIAPVELVFCPAVRIQDVYVRPDWKTGQVQVRTKLDSTLKHAAEAQLYIGVTRQGSSQTLLVHSGSLSAHPGETASSTDLLITNHDLWELDNPCLYQIEVRVQAAGVDGAHDVSRRFGFRDLRVTRGYFRLNGRRIFLKCTHTGNHVPFGQVVPPVGAADLLRKDLLYAKASGFNTVRFISGVAYPYELDICDELGLLVYEESSASWLLKDSPDMKVRYERSLREMILRDRNHPSLAIWGALNETEDGAVYREAASALALVRSLDDTRLVLLSSGRFDGNISVGSLSNPGSSTWEYEWGKEAPGAERVPMKYPTGIGAGDFHLYPNVPQSPDVNHLIRTLGEGGRPIFLSEYGIGSMMDVIHECRMYEQHGIPEYAEDFVLIRSMADRFSADWTRFGMDTVYPFPETLLQQSQLSMARHRLLGFNLIRSNPKICGFNLTGMLDHALTGEGLWRFWRDWKPGAFDAVQDGWAPVRWCLFAEPTHTYIGRPVTLEAVLANEDALIAGEYPAELRVWGPQGVAWTRGATISIASAESGTDGPLAVPVFKETVSLDGSAGAYQLVSSVAKGIAPPDTSWTFHLSDPKALPRISCDVHTWGIPNPVESWLRTRGVRVQPFKGASNPERQIILVGDVSGSANSTADWRELAKRLATGSIVIFLSPLAFRRGSDSAAMLPLARKGRVYEFHDWLYHKECVAKQHAVFNGLQASGLLDWYYYGPTLPTSLFDGQDTPAEVIAAAFAAGYSTPGGYASGVLLGSYPFAAGHFIVNSFPILDHIDSHPVADRLLLNLIAYAKERSAGPAASLPPDFDNTLQQIAY